MEDVDLYRSAAAMIKKHGEDATLQATMKADALLKNGDMAGAKVWREIVKKIDFLQAQETDGATRH